MKEFDQFFKMEKSQSIGDMYKSKGIVKGKDVEIDMDLDFEEAFNGVDKTIEYPCNVLCKTCNATGIKPGAKEIKCEECDGTGYVEGYAVGTSIPFQKTCENCKGNGVFFPKCLSCDGKGLIRQKITEEVNIPRGIYDGLILRLAGKGN